MVYNILCITAIVAVWMSEANSISGSVKAEIDVEESINNATDINLRIDTVEAFCGKQEDIVVKWNSAGYDLEDNYYNWPNGYVGNLFSVTLYPIVADYFIWSITDCSGMETEYILTCTSASTTSDVWNSTCWRSQYGNSAQVDTQIGVLLPLDNRFNLCNLTLSSANIPCLSMVIYISEDVASTTEYLPSTGQITTVGSTTDAISEPISTTTMSTIAGSTPKHRSCLTIKLRDPDAQDGFYSIEDRDSKGLEYSVYCDMTTAGGGWTLVASVHENNLSGSGRCTAGDKWSSEQGNSATHPDGDGNWENRRIFGDVAYATTDDYKSPAYFQLQSRNIMILQVPNDTPADEYVSAAHFQSHTDDGRLADYGGNLYNLFRNYYPLRSGVYKDYSTSQGPSFAVVYDKGTAEDALQQLGPSVQSLMTSGYIQFRAVSSLSYSTYALCPVGKMNPDQGEAHYACIGSAYYHTNNHCGDFSYLDYSGYGTHTTYSASRDFVESTFMIFYR